MPPVFAYIHSKNLKRITLLILIALSLAFVCCKSRSPIVETSFTDSLMDHYSPSTMETVTNGDFSFWKKRLDSMPLSGSTALQYASALVGQFHLYGDITNLLAADSIYRARNLAEKGQDPGLLRSLSALSITRHRFPDAKVYSQEALALGSEKYASTLLYFDALFESGQYALAEKALNTVRATNQYGYFFRASKYWHWKANFDSAVHNMLKAAELSGGGMLKQTALTNAADLYLHEGELEKAYTIYKESLQANAADFHSLQGMGRIALLHDDRVATAKKLFAFIQAHTKSPDALFYLCWAAEAAKDSLAQRQYAEAFVARASDPVYGNMYNKYLIQICTGILHNYPKALAIAEREIANRFTPQTNAWYVWCLHLAGQPDRANEVYKQYVSGKPLEALDLYWMGQYMKANGKGYNALAFFKAAAKNKYDLSPLQMEDLEEQLSK